MLSRLLGAVLSIGAIELSAQTPSGSEVFAKSAHAYLGFKTIQVEVEWKYAMEGNSSIPYMELASERTTSWIGPERRVARVESRATKNITISDGTYLYEYSNKEKEFSKGPLPTDFDRFMNVKVWHYPEVFQMTEPVVADSDRLKISGKQFDCWVLEARVLPGNPAGSAQLEATPGPMRLWIDKLSGLPLKYEMRWVVGSQKVTAVSAMKVVSLQLDQAIPPDTFFFVPPKNAKEVAQ